MVILATLGIALSAGAVAGAFGGLREAGAVAGTLVSAGFLVLVAAMNLVILRAIWRQYRIVRRGGRADDAAFDLLLDGRGLLARLFRPLFRLVSASWHMFPLGFLFGLGFDTATEVSLLGLSATQTARGVPTWSILVFPALFAAGMTLVDTTDGVLMLGAYEWAYVSPLRKLTYNLVITLVSVAVAVLVGWDRNPGPGRGPVRPVGMVLGRRERAERQFRRARLHHHRPVHRGLGRLGLAVPLRRRRPRAPGYASLSSSDVTSKTLSQAGPKVVASATSVASRPRAIRMRPTRWWLCRASKV